MLKSSFWFDFYVILIVELFYDLDLIKNSNQENVCIRNIQCLLEKNVLNTKYVFYIPKEVQGNQTFLSCA